MAQDKLAYVEDVLGAIAFVEAVLSGHSFESFKNDQVLRAAIERQLITVGEALSKFAKLDSEAAGDIEKLPQIVAFRNRLVHNYSGTDVEIVWGVATGYLDALKENLIQRFKPLT